MSRLMTAYFAQGQPAQIATPSSALEDQIGAGTRAIHAVTNGNAVPSDVAPRDGVAVVFVPPNATGLIGTDSAHIVVGLDVTATANDPVYPGPWPQPFSIKRGERISIFANGADMTFTIVMARGDV